MALACAVPALLFWRETSWLIAASIIFCIAYCIDLPVNIQVGNPEITQSSRLRLPRLARPSACRAARRLRSNAFRQTSYPRCPCRLKGLDCPSSLQARSARADALSGGMAMPAPASSQKFGAFAMNAENDGPAGAHRLEHLGRNDVKEERYVSQEDESDIAKTPVPLHFSPCSRDRRTGSRWIARAAVLLSPV